VLDRRRVIPRVIPAWQVTTWTMFPACNQSHDDNKHNDDRGNDR
jgi:hypothetical protein